VDGQTCVIVGAGPRLGLAIAHRFAREGFQIALIARRQEALEQYVAELAAEGDTAAGYQADLAHPEQIPAVFARIVEELGPPDVLVYNATAFTHATPSQLTDQQLLSDLNVNVVSALSCAREVLPAMQAKGEGTIILTGGAFALNTYAPMASLGIGKAALRNLALNLAAEVEAEGIHAATVTILGEMREGTLFDADRIAETYWQLHIQAPGAWSREILYNEAYASTL
jgi:NAD(P)-dependent dehydrogenase (short-subunit alcohol dehydrogenase family)